jgi:AcrR family transcriptional regulator
MYLAMTTATQTPARVRRTQNERRQATRQRILDGAMRCIERSGYSGATVMRIAEEAGVTTGALQHHFGDRRGLMLAVVRVGYERMVADIVDALPSGGTLEQRVDSGVDAMVAGYSSAPAVSAFEIVAALRETEDFQAEHPSLAKPGAIELDRAWLDLFDDAPASDATKRTTRRLIRATILGVLVSGRSGLSGVEQNTIDGLKRSVLHLLTS